MSTFETMTRRRLLKAAGAVASGAALPAPFVKRAAAAEQITVADVGGAPAAALRTAFYDPFEKQTGIRVENVAHESDPVTQFKLVVDANSKIWDVCMVTPDDVARLTEQKNYLEPLDIAAENSGDLVPGSLMPNWFGFSVYGIVMAYRTDTYKGEDPRTGPISGMSPGFPAAAVSTATRKVFWRPRCSPTVSRRRISTPSMLIAPSRSSTRSSRMLRCGGRAGRKTPKCSRTAKSIWRTPGRRALLQPSMPAHP
jgi:hypothetical protein